MSVMILVLTWEAELQILYFGSTKACGEEGKWWEDDRKRGTMFWLLDLYLWIPTWGA